MLKLSCLLLLSLLCLSSFCQVNHPKTKQELISVCDKFMDKFKSGKIDEAFEYIKPFSVIEDYKLDTLAKNTKETMIGLSGSYGKMISVEQISEKLVKTFLSRLTYVLKFEKFYLKFRFILYNSGAGWTITSFKYADDIDDLFSCF